MIKTSPILSMGDAQSIGYHPNLFLGFNPYLSPVFGYGLGLPNGAYGYNGLRLPLMTGSTYNSPKGLLSKMHAKTFMKKFATYPTALSPYYGSLKNKLQLMKHPEYMFTPYAADYGFGKHFGSAMVPNNPYKSAYADYYNNDYSDGSKLKVPNQSSSYQDTGLLAQPSMAEIHKASLIKPLIKIGALLTTAAILGKKTLESPAIRLNPAGMILNGRSS